MHIANNPRATLTIQHLGTWRNEATKREAAQSIYRYQDATNRYTITVYHLPKQKHSKVPQKV